MRTGMFWMTMLAAILLMGHGCTRDNAVVRPSLSLVADPDRSSPRAVLESLRQAYTNRDATAYESLLADDFRFYFCEQDAQRGPFLTRDEEGTIHRKMFSAEWVEVIELDFVIGEAAQDPSKADPLDSEQNLWTVTVSDVALMLRGMREGKGPIVIRVSRGVEQFWLRQECERDPATERPVWKIVEWREICAETP